MFLHLKAITDVTFVLCQFERGPFSNFSESHMNVSTLHILYYSHDLSKSHLDYRDNGAILLDTIMIQKPHGDQCHGFVRLLLLKLV